MDLIKVSVVAGGCEREGGIDIVQRTFRVVKLSYRMP